MFLLQFVPAAAADNLRQLLDESGRIELSNEASNLVSEMFGLHPPNGLAGRLAVRLSDAEIEEDSDAVRFSAGELHRIERISDGQPALFFNSSGLAGRIGSGKLEAGADLIEFWSLTGELLLAAADARISLVETGHSYSLAIKAGPVSSTQLTEFEDGSALVAESRASRLVFSFADSPDLMGEASFSARIDDASGSLRRRHSASGNPAGIFWNVGDVQVSALGRPSAGAAMRGELAFRFQVEAGNMTAPGDLRAELGGLQVDLNTGDGTLTAGIDGIAASAELQRLLWPELGLTLPPASLSASLRSRAATPKAGITVEKVTARLGEADFSGIGALGPAMNNWSIEGRLSGLLAMLSSAGSRDPEALARRLGIPFDTADADADALDLRVEGGLDVLRLNGRAVRLPTK